MNNFLLENDVNHLQYKIKARTDMINPYSIEGYELLSDEFISYSQHTEITYKKRNGK